MPALKRTSFPWMSRQSRVAVYLENSIESVISIFGILKAGGVFLAINLQAQKLSYILRDCSVTHITDSVGAQQISMQKSAVRTKLRRCIKIMWRAFSRAGEGIGMRCQSFKPFLTRNHRAPVSTSIWHRLCIHPVQQGTQRV